MLRGCISSTLCAAYTDKEDHTTHTSMSNLHHAIKYLGKLGPAGSSVGALPSLRCLEEEAYVRPLHRLCLEEGKLSPSSQYFHGKLWHRKMWCSRGPNHSTQALHTLQTGKSYAVPKAYRVRALMLTKQTHLHHMHMDNNERQNISMSVDHLCISSWNRI